MGKSVSMDVHEKPEANLSIILSVVNLHAMVMEHLFGFLRFARNA